MPIHLTAAADDDGRRLDRILRKALGDTPLSAIHRQLRKGDVLVDGIKAAADYRIRQGQTITVNLSGLSIAGHSPAVKSLSGADLEILYEGEGLLVLNKPAGLLVHGRKSLQELVLSYLKEKLPPSLSFRPGPLHRLDRPSSGIIVFSTSLEGARFFSEMMHGRKIKKCYLALVEGRIKKAETWHDELVRDSRRKKTLVMLPSEGGTKTALTTVTPILGNGFCTMILAEIETGRTHQIRAQAGSRGHPLLGDRKYGASPALETRISVAAPFGLVESTFLLHAWRMEFPPPMPRLIEAPLPEEFQKKILELFGVDGRYIYGKV